MLSVYEVLACLALEEFGPGSNGVITRADYVGGTSASPNKLRLTLADGSFLDVWLSTDGDYAYHWEQRRQRGRIYRWDNAPHHPQLSTFPEHLHSGQENAVIESHLHSMPKDALRQVLEFIAQHL